MGGLFVAHLHVPERIGIVGPRTDARDLLDEDAVENDFDVDAAGFHPDCRCPLVKDVEIVAADFQCPAVAQVNGRNHVAYCDLDRGFAVATCDKALSDGFPRPVTFGPDCVASGVLQALIATSQKTQTVIGDLVLPDVPVKRDQRAIPERFPGPTRPHQLSISVQ